MFSENKMAAQQKYARLTVAILAIASSCITTSAFEATILEKHVGQRLLSMSRNSGDANFNAFKTLKNLSVLKVML